MKEMYQKHSSFYYIFWIFVPLLCGSALAWGSVRGVKIAYANLFEKEKMYTFDSKVKIPAPKGVIVKSTISEDKKSTTKETTLPTINNLRYSLVDTKTVATIKQSELAKRIEGSLPKKPELKATALAYVAADLDSGEILLEKNMDMILPIASLTKLITALVSLKTLDQNKIITISQTAVNTYGDTGGLHTGEKIRAGDLLYPLLLESSNDAAEALARSANRDEFIKSMNDETLVMGAGETSFLDASGLSPQNVSTAENLFRIAQYIYKKDRNIFDITAKKSYTVKNHTWVNPTLFLKSSAYIGGKNGYTDEAERTAVSLFSIPQQYGPNRSVAIVVLKSKDRTKDVTSIVNYLGQYIDFPELTTPPASEGDMEFY